MFLPIPEPAKGALYEGDLPRAHETGEGAGMGWHLPRLRKAPAIAGAVLGLIASLPPEVAIENVRDTIAFVGFDSYGWFTAAVLAPAARLVLIPLSVLLIGWAVWPERRKGEITAPLRDWTPANRAPFVLPGLPLADVLFTSSKFGLANFLAIGSRAKPRPGLECSFDPGVPGAQNTSGTDMSYVGIDWEKGKFVWRWTRFDASPPRTFGMTYSPWEMTGPNVITAVSDELFEKLRSKAEFVWSMLTDDVNEAARAGQATIWARTGSANAPFSRITADSWSHYRMVDWRNGRAEAPGCEQLYSVHFCFRQPSFASRAVSRARQWLKGTGRRTPP